MSEKTQIHVKSDVFAALAIVGAETPSVNNIPQEQVYFHKKIIGLIQESFRELLAGRGQGQCNGPNANEQNHLFDYNCILDAEGTVESLQKFPCDIVVICPREAIH
ncbi:unnamed protein product [Porites evermanni]|uniref:Uncharacterized protein n=1 Tax=Porites evermanni TaxID=104178 RepID=A0ABN8MEH5_9CNID|nr:unnamed protein product [Porites evermanni]